MSSPLIAQRPQDASRASWRLFCVLAGVLASAGCSSSRTDPDLAALPDSASLDARLDRSAPDRPTLPEMRPDTRYFWPDLADDRPLKNLEQLQGEAMRTALYNLVKGHVSLSYTKAKEAMLIPASGGIDVHDGKIECIYTAILVAADGTTSPGTINVEHSWPQSEGAGSAPAEGDLHHLFPADANANSHRSSLSFGKTLCGTAGWPACKWSVGGSTIGISWTSSANVMQVRPERRGDIARAHFYFAVRYQMNIPAEEEGVLRIWNALDPPDDGERARTTAIEAIQKNRNPFIDRYDFVEKIADF